MNYQSLLEKEFLPFVIRPARYVGNELGSIHKPDPGLFRVALAFCDLYDQGMSHPGLHRIYQTINALDFAACERCFAPDIDAEARLRDRNLQLFSLESLRPLAEFSLLLALIPGELCITNLLTIIDRSGVGLQSDRRDQSLPLVGAIVPPCFNPEPIADFVDFVLLSRAEAVLLQVLHKLHSAHDIARSEKLKLLAAVEGVYVPGFYRPEFVGNSLAAVKRIEPDAPEIIKIPLHADNALQPAFPIVPYEIISREVFAVELTDDAGHNCRNCPATSRHGSISTDPAILANAVCRGLEETGFGELALLANCSSDYRHFDRLLEILAERLRGKQARIHLPPLRPSMRTLESSRLLSHTCGKSQLTFLLEAGTDRLREVMGRYYSIEEFYQVAANALAAGWNSLRLNFTVGLPTETAEDRSAITEILRNCGDISQKYNSKAMFQVALAPYIPKAHTPWQWEPQLSLDEYTAIAEQLRRSIRSRNVQFSSRPPDSAFLEGVLARGDRHVANAILRAFELGCRFDMSGEHFDLARWQSAFAAAGLDLSQYTGQYETAAVLPWDHIERGRPKDQLLREAQDARRIETPQQSTAGSFKLGEIIMLKPELAEQILLPAAEPLAQFGRRPKRKAEPVNMVVPRSRVRLLWTKDEDVRFVGHLATMRVFERAIVRARLPVDYSQGFHPRQKLAFGPPLTLGYTSQAEYLDLQLETPFQQEMIPNLNRALPPGFRIIQGKTIFGKASSLSSLINLAVYETQLDDPSVVTATMVEDLLSRETVVISRNKGEETREADIRKSIIKLELRLSDPINNLYMELAMGNLGFVKPEEVLGQCLMLSEEKLLPLRICRTRLLIDREGNRLTPFEVD